MLWIPAILDPRIYIYISRDFDLFFCFYFEVTCGISKASHSPVATPISSIVNLVAVIPREPNLFFW